MIAFLISLSLLLICSCNQTDDFQFAWLSDTHISETSTGEEDLRNAIVDINKLDGLDFVLVSGDITDLNISNNLKTAKQILDELDIPYYIIPGNHDTKWTDSGNQNFLDFWGNDKFLFEHHGYTFIGIHQGPELRMMDGHFAPHDLDWLDSQLKNLHPQNKPIIFVTHYPIDPSVDNYSDFLHLIKDYNVRLFLHGHGHRNRLRNYAGVPGVMGRSSLRGDNPIGGFTIAEVRHDSIFFSERLTGLGTKGVWGKVALRDPGIRIDTSLIQYADFSVNSLYPNVKTDWIFDAGNLIAASPVISDSFLFVGDAGGLMHCLFLNNGKQKWQFDAGNRIYATAALYDDKIVFVNLSGKLFCLSVQDAALLWQIQLPCYTVAVPVIENDVIYIGSSDNIFRAIDLENGNIIWEFKEVGGYVETKPLIYKNKIIFGAWDGKLYALNKKDGSKAWVWNDGRTHMLYSPAACWPVVSDNSIFIVAPDRYMSSVNYDNGKTNWRSNKFKVRESIGISEDGNLIYARCMRDTVFTISSNPENQNVLWVKNFGFGYDIAPSMLVENNGIGYLSTKNGLILAFNSKNGYLIWKYKFGNTLVHTVAPLNAKKIYLSNMDGKVFCLSHNK